MKCPRIFPIYNLKALRVFVCACAHTCGGAGGGCLTFIPTPTDGDQMLTSSVFFGYSLPNLSANRELHQLSKTTTPVNFKIHLSLRARITDVCCHIWLLTGVLRVQSQALELTQQTPQPHFPTHVVQMYSL